MNRRASDRLIAHSTVASFLRVTPAATSPTAPARHPWFVRGDVDGFFGLFLDNLLQLMLITSLCPLVCGFPGELIYARILPGAAISILAGNLYYAWQARRLMRATGRTDVTALPYGINTVSLLAFIFLIMGPIYQATGNATLAWQAGLLACFLNGLMEIACAFFGDWVRRHTPRAALLSSLAGIAITFIAMGFVFQIFASPILALLPMLLILFSYASRIRLPFGLPGGFLAVLVGIALAWILRALGQPFFEPSTDPHRLGLYLPTPVPGDLFALITSATGWQYLSVIFPMGLFNIIGSLQNLESAEAAGDRFDTRPSLLVNGFCSVIAAFLGSAFPTTIYIGHPAWKAMGARTGYSVLNGGVITLLCLIGAMPLVLRVVPLEAALGILLWIGLIITAQAFQEVPKATRAGGRVGARSRPRRLGACADRNHPARDRLEPPGGRTPIQGRALPPRHDRPQPRVHAQLDGPRRAPGPGDRTTFPPSRLVGRPRRLALLHRLDPRLRTHRRRRPEPLRVRRRPRLRPDLRHRRLDPHRTPSPIHQTLKVTGSSQPITHVLRTISSNRAFQPG